MLPIVFAVLTVLTWAAATLVMKAAMDLWPVGLGGTCSRVVTLVLLGAWVLGTGKSWRRLRAAGLLWWLVAMGVVSIVINSLLFASLKWTTATNNALLFRLDLVFAVLIGAWLGLERVGVAQLALLPPMLVGMALVIGVSHFEWRGHFVGDLMVVGAAAAFAVNAYLIRHILRAMDEEAVALYNHAMSGLGFVGIALVGRESVVVTPLLEHWAAWFWVVALGVTSAVSLPLYYAALHRMAVWKLRTWMLAIPVVVAFVEWAVWGMRLTASQWAGTVLVLAGLAVLIRIESRAPAAGFAGESPVEPAAERRECGPGAAESPGRQLPL